MIHASTIFVCCGIVFLSLKVGAYEPASGNVTVTFGNSIYKTNIDRNLPDGAEASPWLGGFNLIANGDLYEKGSLEVALMYLHQQYYISRDNMAIVEKVKRLHITLGYRHWFGSKFSVGLGVMSNYSLGDVKVMFNSFEGQPEEPKTSAHNVADYGVDLSLQYEVWQQKKWGAIVEARYTYLTDPQRDELSDNYIFMFGMRYQIQQGRKQ